MILLENGLIYSMVSKPFKGTVAIDNGKIIQVIEGSSNIKADEKYDVSGCVIMPGFIDAHTHQGIFQGDIGWAGMDGNETTDPVTPQLRALDAINPEDPGLVEAAVGGVTAVNTGPGSANVVGGQFCLIKTSGSIVDDMVVKNPSCIKLAFGENPKAVYGKNDKVPQTRMAIAALLREWLNKADEYRRKKAIAETKNEEEDKKPDYDCKLEVLSKALSGEIPVHAHCHRADDIVTAIRIAEEFKLKLVLIHSTEGHKIADFIAGKKIPAVVGPSFVGREKPELREISFKTPGILSAAGVQVCLQTDSFPPLTYFQSVLCMAVKEGMERMKALEAVTRNPAMVLGVAERIGAIKEGMDADIVIWDGDPTEFYSRVFMTFIDGSLVYRYKG